MTDEAERPIRLVVERPPAPPEHIEIRDGVGERVWAVTPCGQNCFLLMPAESMSASLTRDELRELGAALIEMANG